MDQKRLLDSSQRFLDLLGIAIWFPIFLIVFPVVVVSAWLKLGRPIFFEQVRPGRRGRLFTFYKIRTMTNARDSHGNLLPDEQRLIGFGKFLRKTSMDELPQVWNVIKGDVSLVGPRPLLVEYLSLYSHRQAKRHDVRPGITGWAQINGRNAISWEEKLELDTWYVENRSLKLYFRILFLSILKILKKDGVSAASCATMPRFEGSRSINEHLEPLDQVQNSRH